MHFVKTFLQKIRYRADFRQSEKVRKFSKIFLKKIVLPFSKIFQHVFPKKVAIGHLFSVVQNHRKTLKKFSEKIFNHLLENFSPRFFPDRRKICPEKQSDFRTIPKHSGVVRAAPELVKSSPISQEPENRPEHMPDISISAEFLQLLYRDYLEAVPEYVEKLTEAYQETVKSDFAPDMHEKAVEILSELENIEFE